MLTGSRSTGRSSANTSMRSTSFTMRSVSSQISVVSGRSSSPADCSSNCAAPRMPDSGFLISCASMAASAITERAAPRWVSWRSILSAMVRSCSMTMTWSVIFRQRRDVQIDQPFAGIARRREIDLVFVDRRAARGAPARSASAAASRTAPDRAACAGAASGSRLRRIVRRRHWRRRSCRRARP